MSQSKASRRAKAFLLTFTRVVVTAIFLMPFYTAFVYSFKNRSEIAMTGLQFPRVFHLDNFRQAIENTYVSGMPFPTILWNTIYATLIGTVVIVLLSAMAAYVIARRRGRFYRVVYSLMVMTLLIPFQAFMFPLYVLLRQMGMLNSLEGFTLAKIATGLGYSVIITTGFVRGLPYEIEEAAMVDGSTMVRSFFKIVLPLMRPIILTSVVINALGIWNDFGLAFIILTRPAKYVVSLMQFVFFGTNSIEIHLAFALFSLTMIPILILYFALQKYIVSGIAVGSVKG